MEDRKTLLLTEHVPRRFPRQEIPGYVGKALWRDYGSEVSVDFPSPKTDDEWLLTAQGWVGYIPLTPELGLSLQPKVPLDNLFRMLEYAYRLRSFRFLEDLVGCRSLEEFYEHLANVLAQRVLDRARKGLYRAYLVEAEDLPYVRGRLDIRQLMQKPWSPKLHCQYEEHTPNVEENQILAWTLERVARSQMCSSRVQPTVRRAYHSLRGLASTSPFSPQDCVGRSYTRLNDDYHPMHALCRFFLEHSGPSHEMGDRTVLPFLVHMPRLFELFVAEWLKTHLPESLTLSVKEKVAIGQPEHSQFQIDLVLSDAATGRPICVLDTKYRAQESPEAGDITQIMAYADMKDCTHAVLVYPQPLMQPLDGWPGKSRIRVQSMAFSLDGDLEAAGCLFLDGLLGRLRQSSR